MTLWLWFQAISFQIVWFFCVVGGNKWLVFPIMILLLHLAFTPSRLDDVKILSFVLVGFAIDMACTQLGLFVFHAWPYWLLVLWLAFVLNFGHSLRFLRRLKLLWLIIIGALGGGYAYWISWQLGAVIWPYGALVTTAIIATIWALLLPLLVKGDLYIRRLSDA